MTPEVKRDGNRTLDPGQDEGGETFDTHQITGDRGLAVKRALSEATRLPSCAARPTAIITSPRPNLCKVRPARRPADRDQPAERLVERHYWHVASATVEDCRPADRGQGIFQCARTMKRARPGRASSAVNTVASCSSPTDRRRGSPCLATPGCASSRFASPDRVRGRPFRAAGRAPGERVAPFAVTYARRPVTGARRPPGVLSGQGEVLPVGLGRFRAEGRQDDLYRAPLVEQPRRIRRMRRASAATVSGTAPSGTAATRCPTRGPGDFRHSASRVANCPRC